MLDFKDNPEFKFYFVLANETFLLDQAPDGWLNFLIEFATSKTYTGLRRSLSLPFKYIGNAAFIIRREYYQYFVMANITLQIDMRNNDLTYTTIYSGKLNFADSSLFDGNDGFTVSTVSADFSTNIDAYDSTSYDISLDGGINLELTSIAINETASMVLSGPPDGLKHSDYFVPIQMTNNVQSSLRPSVQSVPYSQFRDPILVNSNEWFFQCNRTGLLYLNGAISGTIYGGDFGGHHVRIVIENAVGILYTLLEVESTIGADTFFDIPINYPLPVTEGDRLFLYMEQVDAETANTGISIGAGVINLSYQTQTPPTMCQAISGELLFSRILQAMNYNLNSGPNQPVAYQSFLLRSGVLKTCYFTSSDSIRSANGSFFTPGDIIGQGIYKVISGIANYAGADYTLNQTFAFNDTADTFSAVVSGTYVQKVQSIFIGYAYNHGDSLEAGGTYLVEEGTSSQGGGVIYNGVFIPVGTYFKYVLGQDTFTASNVAGDNFVKQVAEDPKIVTNLTDFFQWAKSNMFGNAAIGQTTVILEDQPPIPAVFLEDLSFVYQGGAPIIADLGNVTKDWKGGIPATDLMYSNFKAGYNDQQYTTANGYQEVNSQQIYSSGVRLTPSIAPADSYPNEANFISPYRADCLGIEEIRVAQGDTASSRSNNDTFVVWINPIPIVKDAFTYYHPALKEDSLTSLVGVPDGFYNFFGSPKSSLYRGAPYLASILWNMGDYPLNRASALKNGAMSYVRASDGFKVSEATPVLVSQLGDPLFIPMYYTGPQNSALAVLDSLNANPYAPIAFTVNNVRLKAFLSDFKVAPANRASQDVKVLLCADNDMTQFIR